MRPPLRLGLLASGRGSNVQAIIDACRAGRITAEPCVVISNNRDAEVLARARRAELPALHLSARTHPDPAALDGAIADALCAHGATLVVLAGYMKRIGPATLARFPGRIINVHPSLLPRYGGQGMYGARVHAAVLAAGERTSGATVHLVDAEYDRGAILAQRTVPVLAGDTPESLAQRVLQVEHALYVDTIDRIARGTLAGDAAVTAQHGGCRR